MSNLPTKWLLAAFSCLVVVGAQAAEQQQVRYEPAVVRLSGVVKIEKRYGPPGFGTSPATDRQISVPILTLDAPVTVVGNPPNSRERLTVDGDTYRNVTRMQLVFTTPGAKVGGLDGERATFTGTLFEKVSGENYTDVLLSVQGVALGAGPAR